MHAQDTEQRPAGEEEESSICLPTKYVWNGSLDEIRNIERNPVPKSFKRASGGGCGGYADPEELIQWHMRFGSEASVKAALDFVQKRYGDPQKLGDMLIKDIVEAGAALAREVHSAVQNAGAGADSHQAAQRVLQSDKWTRSLGQLHYQPWHLVRMANLYAMAAERFASPNLRDDAHTVFNEYRKTSDAVERMSKIDKWPDDVQKPFLGMLNYAEFNITPMKVDLSIALLDIVIEPSDANIAALSATLERYAEPSYQFAGRLAFSDGDDFCDFAKEDVRNPWEQEFLDKCDKESWFEVNAIHFVYVSDRLALLRSGNEWNADEFLTIYQKDRKDNGNWRGYWDGLDDRPVAMKLAIADRYIRQATRKQLKQDKAWSDGDTYRALQRALDFCIEASEMFKPAHDRVRFRQLAKRAISVERQIQNLNESDLRIGAQQMQSMAFIRTNLERLDDMVLGQPN